ncbi:hypothetical protein NL676_011572 [Syzygium grande]|nr:hypothetical protein NL676_011572 [Syzygium grande]
MTSKFNRIEVAGLRLTPLPSTVAIQYVGSKSSTRARTTASSFGWIDVTVALRIGLEKIRRENRGQGRQWDDPDGTERPTFYILNSPLEYSSRKNLNRKMPDTMMHLELEFGVALQLNSPGNYQLVVGSHRSRDSKLAPGSRCFSRIDLSKGDVHTRF